MAEGKNLISLKRARFRRAQRNRPPTQIVALDIDGDLLRVVMGARRGEATEFTRVDSTPLPLAENADRSEPMVLGKAIAGALEALRLKPGSVAMGIPRGEVILRTLVLPDLQDPRELASIVQLQVGRDLPYRKEDAVIDFEIRPLAIPANAGEVKGESDKNAETDGSDSKVEALVGIAQREVVEFYRKACDAAGVKLAALTLLPFANARCLATSGLPLDAECTALVTLRVEALNVDVVRSGKLLFSRDATLKENHHDEPANPPFELVDAAGEAEPAEPVAPAPPMTAVERITIEILRSLHGFGGMMPDTPVKQVLIAGGTGLEPEVAQAAAKRLGVPVSVVDLQHAFAVEGTHPATITGSLSAMGLAIAATDPAGLPFNFLDPKRPAVQRDMKRIRTLAAMAALVVLFVGVLGVRSYLVRQRVAVQTALQAEISTLARNQPLFRKTRAQLAGIQSWMKEEKDWLQHYAYLSAVLPGAEEIYITSLSVSSQGSIRLAVQARSGEVLAKLDKQLRDAGYDVKPQPITPGADKFGYNFRSSVELIVPAKMTIDLSKVKTPVRPADDVSLSATGRGNAAAARKGSRAAELAGGSQ